MARILRVAGAQLGGIQRAEPREAVVTRMIALMDQAFERGCDLVVYPELALTTFFPRYHLTRPEEIDQWFETEMPNAAVQPLFDRARDHKIGFYLGYGELAEENGEKHRYNTSILVDKSGSIVGKYRKIHLPGHSSYESDRDFQTLEKYYFSIGDKGFPVWNTMGGMLGMCICNDRRWPETFRIMGLQGVEMVLLGFNTPTLNHKYFEPPHLRVFYSDLCVQAGAYQNSTWVVAVAKAGEEDGQHLMSGSVIVAPTGQIVARSYTDRDELVMAACDLDECRVGKQNMFNFAAHRRPEHYKLLVQ